jgi:acetoin utilization protein AcuB
MIIKDVMTKNPVCVDENTPITEAKQLMLKNNFSKLPVLNSSKKLVGIITKNDIAKASPSEATTLDMYEISYLLSKLNCKKCMTTKVLTVSENEVVEEAAKIMIDNGIGCVPVVENDVVVGIVTESDLFQLFTNMFGARYSGVRANFYMQDKPGQLALFTSKLAEAKGNLIAIVTRESEKAGTKRITVKASDITLDAMKSILSESGAEVIDIRMI